MSTNLTTDAKILLAHYCAGRYPDHVPVGLPDDLSELSAELIAELCAARALGAFDLDRGYELLRTAQQLAAMVAELLADKAPEPDAAAPAAPEPDVVLTMRPDGLADVRLATPKARLHVGEIERGPHRSSNLSPLMVAFATPLQVERRYVPPSRDGVGSYSVTPQGAPEPAAAPKCAHRACAEWRTVLLDHLRACGVFSPQVLAEATATLRPGPDGVPLTVEAVTAGQPIRPGAIGTQTAEPEPLDLWPVIKAGSRVRLHPTGKPGVIARVHCEEGVATLTIDFGWDAKAGAPAPASCKVPAGTTAEAIVRALAGADPNFRGHDPEHECALCGVLGARTPDAHKPTCPWRMARAWVA